MDSNYGLGELLKANGDHGAAIAVYDTIIEHGLAPNDPRPYHYAGWSYYYGLTEYEKSLAYYDKALHIDPNYAKVLYNKALVFRELRNENLYEENVAKAFKLTLQAYQSEGDDNPRVTFSLAILYTERRELDEALAMLERSLQKERLYVLRAGKERAFAVFRERANEPYYSRFKDLLDRYRPVAGTLAATSGPYDPTTYNE